MEEEKRAADWPPKKVICVGAVVMQGDKVLFVRQSEGQSFAGKWSIPWGVVESHETPDEAVLREISEEGGIKASIEGLLGYQNFGWESSLALIYLCQHQKGEPMADGIETDQASYFSVTELDELNEPISLWCEWLVRLVMDGKYRVIPIERANPREPMTAFF